MPVPHRSRGAPAALPVGGAGGMLRGGGGRGGSRRRGAHPAGMSARPSHPLTMVPFLDATSALSSAASTARCASASATAISRWNPPTGDIPATTASTPRPAPPKSGPDHLWRKNFEASVERAIARRGRRRAEEAAWNDGQRTGRRSEARRKPLMIRRFMDRRIDNHRFLPQVGVQSVGYGGHILARRRTQPREEAMRCHCAG